MAIETGRKFRLNVLTSPRIDSDIMLHNYLITANDFWLLLVVLSKFY